MYNFTFHRPTTVRQAAGLLARNPDGKLLAGGHSLLPVMKQRLASPSAIVDLSLVEGLSGVELKGRSVVIGAYYYLRVIKLMYFDDATERAPIRAGWDVQALLGFNALLLIGVLPWVGVLMELCRQAIKTLS